MKKLLFILTLALTTSTVFAQSAKYNDAMTKTLAEMDTLKSGDQFMAIANKFERIALAEKKYVVALLLFCTCPLHGRFYL